MLDGHGGVVIGSEMSGSVRKVTISNCVFDGTDRGIRMKTMRGRGGIVEEIRVSNIVMKNISREALKFNMFYHPTPDEPVSERTPQFRNIHLSDITITESKQAGFILGLPEMPVENITFSNINIQSKIGFTVQDAKNIEFHNVDIAAEEGPAFSVKKASGIEFDGVSGSVDNDNEPVIFLEDVQNVYVHDCFPKNETKAFVEVNGETTKNVVIRDNNFSLIKSPVKKGSEVKAETLK
jgi:polygalacturonase